MPNPQQEETPSQADAPTADPGTPSAPDQPTLHEFLTKLATSSQARAEFDADPRAALDQAGLGDMTATDVLQATSLVLDYAPVEVVQEYDRSLQGSVEKFAASNQHVAAMQLHHAHPHEQEVTDLNIMMQSKPDFSAGGDVDQQIAPPAPAPTSSENKNEVEQNDSHNMINIDANGAGVGNSGGNGNGMDNSHNHGDHGGSDGGDSASSAGGDAVGGVANNLVGNLGGGALNAPVEGVTNTVHEATDLSGGLPVNDVVGGVTETAGELPVAGDVAVQVGHTAANLPVAGPAVEGVAQGDPIGGVGDVVGGLPVAGPVAEGVAAPVTDALPL